MKILVPVKRVVDPYVKISVRKDNTGVDTQNLKMSINPFDAIALEEAVRLKEQGKASEIIVININHQKQQDILRYALAIGADKAILVNSNEELEPINVAKVIQHFVKKLSPDLILMGKQAIDDDQNQVGQMLSAILDWPFAGYSSKITQDDDKSLIVEREVDEGIEVLKCKLPSIVTADLRLNEPRIPAIPNIMKAKSKPFEEIDINTLNIDLKPRIKVISVNLPKVRTAGILVDNVEALIDCLKNQAKVLG